MNYRINTLLIILFLPFLSNGIDLQTAVSQQLVKAQFMANGGHRNKCIKLILENNLAKPTEIRILPGTYLENPDTTRQDFIIVENNLFVLQGSEKRKLLLKGFCCKRRRGCPRNGDLFAIRPKVDKQMAALCNLLLQLKEFEYSGQEAIWCLADNADPNQIVGADSSKTMQLRQYIGKTIGRTIKPFIWTSYNKPAIITKHGLDIISEGNHYVREVKANDLVEYAIYNEADSAISEIRTERVVANRWNKHNCKWKFKVEDLNPANKYYMRIKVNGTIQKEWLYYFWS